MVLCNVCNGATTITSQLICVAYLEKPEPIVSWPVIGQNLPTLFSQWLQMMRKHPEAHYFKM